MASRERRRSQEVPSVGKKYRGREAGGEQGVGPKKSGNRIRNQRRSASKNDKHGEEEDKDQQHDMINIEKN